MAGGFWNYALEDPGALAVVDPDGTEFSAAEVSARSHRMVHGLRSLGLQTGDNPFIQSAFGKMVTPETIALIDAAKESFTAGGSPFTGPVVNQDGDTVWAEGETPTYADIEQMDFFVNGVTGSTS